MPTIRKCACAWTRNKKEEVERPTTHERKIAASVPVHEQEKGRGRATNNKREGNWFSDQAECINQHNAPDHNRIAQKTNEFTDCYKRERTEKKRSKLLSSYSQYFSRIPVPVCSKLGLPRNKFV
ncbi:hypothetical protein DPMN_024148 [Dreissena polymorpha]|uniref:Uncharacterized protein n=1 Tax=Dreissena polymorpha TaxID=45954 RepID=A0A9D4LQV6_DREPO|nr:hypothetical protein DPMN_024148 [Dreissena polymorpha]